MDENNIKPYLLLTKNGNEQSKLIIHSSKVDEALSSDTHCSFLVGNGILI